MRTDEQGNYRFASLPINKKLEIRVAKEGCIDEKSWVVLQADVGGEQRQDLTIKPILEHTITGVVTNADGEPIANVAVSSTDAMKRASCKTDALGKYKLVGQLEDNGVLFRADGYVAQQHNFDPAAEEKSINVEMKIGRRATGVVIDERGQPLVGVNVVSNKYTDIGWMSQPCGECMTDADGVFVIDSLPDKAQLRFSKKGYASIDRVPLPEIGDELPDRIRMPDLGLVRGKVIDRQTGKPVKSFRVYYTWSRVQEPDDPPKGGLSMASHRGDLFASAEGDFKIDGFRRGLPLEVTVEAEGYRKCVVERAVALAADARPRIFKMERVDPEEILTIAGRFVDSENKGIAGVEVRLICSDKRGELVRRDSFPFNWEMILSGQIAEDSRVEQYLETTTDAQGRFSFSKVLSSSDIEVVWWGEDVVRSRKPGIESLSKTDQQSLTISAAQSGTVRGSIDIKANRYASPRIRVGDVRYNSEILEDGKLFEIRGVPAGKHEVLISGNPKPLKIPGREDDGSFTTSIIKRIPVVVRAGEISRADVDSD